MNIGFYDITYHLIIDIILIDYKGRDAGELLQIEVYDTGEGRGGVVWDGVQGSVQPVKGNRGDQKIQIIE
jgi:hypothetical protein